MSLRGVAIIALAAATLSLPMVSAAHAQSDTHRARHARIYNTTREPSTLSDRSRPGTPNAEPAFEDYPTWPEGSPNYHGGNS
jgi:hypothetical protein